LNNLSHTVGTGTSAEVA